MRAELRSFRTGVAARFEQVEDDATALEEQVRQLDERAQREYEANQKVIRTAQSQIALLTCRLTVTESQVKGISATVVLLRRRMETEYEELNRRLGSDERGFRDFKKGLAEDIEALKTQLYDAGERNHRFRSYATKQIAELTADIGRLNNWRFAQDVREAADDVFHIIRSIISAFVPGAEGLAANALERITHKILNDFIVPVED